MLVPSGFVKTSVQVDPSLVVNISITPPAAVTPTAACASGILDAKLLHDLGAGQLPRLGLHRLRCDGRAHQKALRQQRIKTVVLASEERDFASDVAVSFITISIS